MRRSYLLIPGLALVTLALVQFAAPLLPEPFSSFRAQSLLLAEVMALEDLRFRSPVVLGSSESRSRFAAELIGRYWVDTGLSRTISDPASWFIHGALIVATRLLALGYAAPSYLLFLCAGGLLAFLERLPVRGPLVVGRRFLSNPKSLGPSAAALLTIYLASPVPSGGVAVTLALCLVFLLTGYEGMSRFLRLRTL